MNREYGYFERLIEKYLSGNLLDEEQQHLDILLKKNKNFAHFKKISALNYSINKEWLEIDPVKRDAVLLEIIDGKPKVKKSLYRNIRRIAAILTLVLGGGLIYYMLYMTRPSSDQVVTLNLNRGIKKKIKKGDQGIIVENDGLRIEQHGDTLAYIRKGSSIENIDIDELVVPYGETSVIVLSEGTIINLNAGSSIKYPDGFTTHNKREVFLNGEAYFQVSHDQERPFLVHTEHLEIEVLGTQFNVQAYSDEKTSNAVLVSGSVQVRPTSLEEDNKMVLNPGMQALYMPGSSNLEIASVNTATYTAWVKGQLYFYQARFSQIARVLERKFDVHIDIENKMLKNEQFTAKFKAETLEQILKSFNESYSFEYDIKENTVVIK